MRPKKVLVSHAAQIMADMGNDLLPCPLTEFGLCYVIPGCDGFENGRKANSKTCWEQYILETDAEAKKARKQRKRGINE